MTHPSLDPSLLHPKGDASSFPWWNQGRPCEPATVALRYRVTNPHAKARQSGTPAKAGRKGEGGEEVRNPESEHLPAKAHRTPFARKGTTLIAKMKGESPDARIPCGSFWPSPERSPLVSLIAQRILADPIPGIMSPRDFMLYLAARCDRECHDRIFRPHLPHLHSFKKRRVWIWPGNHGLPDQLTGRWASVFG